MNAGKTRSRDWAEYYDRRGVLGEIEETEVGLSLDEAVRAGIVSGKRHRPLRNVSVKLDPVHVVALKKIATMKAIPYQTLIRQWLAAGIRAELRIGRKEKRAS